MGSVNPKHFGGTPSPGPRQARAVGDLRVEDMAPASSHFTGHNCLKEIGEILLRQGYRIIVEGIPEM